MRPAPNELLWRGAEHYLVCQRAAGDDRALAMRMYREWDYVDVWRSYAAAMTELLNKG